MPPSIKRNLNYIDSAYVRNNPGNNFLVYSLRVNDLYDPDPLILSGSVSGFKELMQFYLYYRVLTTTIHFDITNNEAFSLMYGIVLSQQNLTGTITNRDDAINSLENDFSTRGRILAAKGGIDRDNLRLTFNIWDLLGNKAQYMAENGYIGNGLATPSIPLWANFIVASPTGTPLNNGYTTTTTLNMHAEFFGRTNLRA